MPILIKVESKSFSGRLFHTLTFTVLILGGITMIYPFLIMFSGSLRTDMDENDLDLLPRFLYQDEVLYQKFLEFKYDQNINQLNEVHLRRDFGFQFVQAPEMVHEAAVEDFQAFMDEKHPFYWMSLGGMSTTGGVQQNQRALRRQLSRTFENTETFSRVMGSSIERWTHVAYQVPDWLSNRADYDDNVLFQQYQILMRQSPAVELRLVSLSGYFLSMVIYPQYQDFASFQEAFGLDIPGYHAFRLPERVPGVDQPVFRAHWVDFILGDLNTSFVRVDRALLASYQDFLSNFYGNEIDELNQVWESSYGSFDEIALPAGEYLRGSVRRDYLEFLQMIPPEAMQLTGPEFQWRRWLEEKYESIDQYNAAYEAQYASFSEIWMPFAQFEYAYTMANKRALRSTFATRNFINVVDAVFVEGRVFFNTLVFCSLSVFFAVLINPLAAYALSRFKLPGSYKILLLMMAVMAFPPMVTTIPVFIMMQNLGLMNTFAALLLPTIANGYLIFLLKGFFDSLPTELYEAAELEGASELRMFYSITMALSKPILAVVALSAFNSAYTVFLFALIVAPAEHMWLLPVWLYQYRETVSMGGVFASVILASVPPMVVFLFAQNIILRGIVVPVEK